MESTEFEKEFSRVYGLLDELETGKLAPGYGNGYDKRVYNRRATRQELNEKTEELCTKLQNADVTKYSLEMQIWWRDHQKADKARIEKEMNSEKTELEKEQAIAKLTEYERRLLGL